MNLVSLVRETITFGRNVNSLEAVPTVLKEKKYTLVGVRETFWKAKVQPGLKEIKCTPIDLSFSV